MRPSGHRRRRQFHRKRQPTDSVQLLTGQQQLMNLRFSTDDENEHQTGTLLERREGNEVVIHIGAGSARTAV
jgi:hypothetical protein